MTTDITGDTSTLEILRLRSEALHLRKLLEQRESSLALLNRRLMVLERTDARAMDDRLASMMEQIAQQEESIAQLRRELEGAREQNAACAESEARARHQVDESSARIEHLTEEIGRLYATRLFRYASPLRKIYGRLRSP